MKQAKGASPAKEESKAVKPIKNGKTVKETAKSTKAKDDETDQARPIKDTTQAKAVEKVKLASTDAKAFPAAAEDGVEGVDGSGSGEMVEDDGKLIISLSNY